MLDVEENYRRRKEEVTAESGKYGRKCTRRQSTTA